MRRKQRYRGDRSFLKMSPGEARQAIIASDKKARDAVQLGKLFAGYVEGRGCFIGEIIRTNKAEFVVRTRTGNTVKLPYRYALSEDGFKHDYASWDAIAAENNEVTILP